MAIGIESSNIVAIGRNAGYELTTECDVCCIGDDAQSPKGVSGWVHIKGLYDGPMIPEKISLWREICKPNATYRPSELAERFSRVVEVIPQQVSRDSVRTMILSKLADAAEDRRKAAENVIDRASRARGV